MKSLFVLMIVLAMSLASCATQDVATDFTDQPLSQAARASEPSTDLRSPFLPAPASSRESAGEKCSLGEPATSLLFWVTKGREWYLTPIDPTTGLALCNPNPMKFREVSFQTISPDRRTLAVIEYPEPMISNGQLKFIDLQTWQTISTSVQIEGWINAIAFNPSSTKLAISYNEVDDTEKISGYTILQVDVQQPSQLQQTEGRVLTRFLAYSALGDELVVYGAPFDQVTSSYLTPARISLYSSSDLSVIWESNIAGLSDGTFKDGTENQPTDYVQWHPAVAFDPARSRLYIAHADRDVFTWIDIRQRKLETVEVHPAQSWIERLLSASAGVAQAKVLRGTIKEGALSPDGSRLYVAGYIGDPVVDEKGNWQFNMQSLELQVIDTISGREIQRVSTQTSQVEAVPGQPLLLLRGWDMERSWTDILDSKTNRVVHHLPDQMVQIGRLINGSPVYLSLLQESHYTRIQILDPETLETRYDNRVYGYYIDLR